MDRWRRIKNILDSSEREDAILLCDPLVVREELEKVLPIMYAARRVLLDSGNEEKLTDLRNAFNIYDK